MLVLPSPKNGAWEHGTGLLGHHGLRDASHLNGARCGGVLGLLDRTVGRDRLIRHRCAKLYHLGLASRIRGITMVWKGTPAVNTVRIVVPLGAALLRVVWDLCHRFGHGRNVGRWLGLSSSDGPVWALLVVLIDTYGILHIERLVSVVDVDVLLLLAHKELLASVHVGRCCDSID